MVGQPIVTLRSGILLGTIKRDWKDKIYYSFQGIPYAKPPLGKLRFKAPVPAGPWKGIRDASVEGNGCYSRNMLGELSGSEDCLYLNVYTPKLPEAKNSILKSVMVWIHGGGFIGGSGSSEVYGPDFLISEDVVVVTFNYRVGLLGFACFDDPAIEIPGNAALKDQVMALKWVQENISHFCGNPQNVTIFGESAGAASVHYLTLSPMTKGLFHKAIIQSAVATCLWAEGQRTAPVVNKSLMPSNMSESEVAETLQKLPVEELFELQETIPDPLVVCYPHPIGPVVEKPSKETPFLVEKPIDVIKSGKFHQVPLIIGYNSKEGILLEIKITSLYGEMKWLTDFEDAIPFDLNLTRGSPMSKTVAEKIRTFYYGNEKPSYENVNSYHMMQTDNTFFIPINKVVRLQTANSTTPIYFYRMSLDTQLNLFKIFSDITHTGACHGDDLGYLFKTLATPDVPENSEEYQGISRFIKLWANFAKTGNPTPVEEDPLIDVTWPPTQPEKLHFLDLGANLSVGFNPEDERVKFWDEIYRLTPWPSKL